MPCPRTEDLCALIDQALQPAQATALHDHLQTCLVCAQQLQSLRGLRESLQALPAPVLDAQFGLRLQGRLPDGRAVQMQLAVFARGTQVFQATVLGDAVPDDAAETFFASLRLPS